MTSRRHWTRPRPPRILSTAPVWRHHSPWRQGALIRGAATGERPAGVSACALLSSETVHLQRTRCDTPTPRPSHHALLDSPPPRRRRRVCDRASGRVDLRSGRSGCAITSALAARGPRHRSPWQEVCPGIAARWISLGALLCDTGPADKVTGGAVTDCGPGSPCYRPSHCHAPG